MTTHMLRYTILRAKYLEKYSYAKSSRTVQNTDTCHGALGSVEYPFISSTLGPIRPETGVPVGVHLWVK